MPTRIDDSELTARCQKVGLLLLDVDGVLSEGGIFLNDQGTELKRFSVRDGLAIDFWHAAGHRTAILSGRACEAVKRRAEQLKIAKVVQGAKLKFGPFQNVLRDFGLAAGAVCYMGDDIPDVPVLRAAGLAGCPSDAAPEAVAAAHYVTEAPGGRGAVREMVELVLKRQGAWGRVTAPHFPSPIHA